MHRKKVCFAILSSIARSSDFQELSKQEEMQVHGGAPIVYHQGTGFLGQLFTVLVNMGQSERFLVDRSPATLMECQGWLKTYKYAAYMPPEELRKFALLGQIRMDTGLSVVHFPPTGKAFRECRSFASKTCARKYKKPSSFTKFITALVENELLPTLMDEIPKQVNNTLGWKEGYEEKVPEKTDKLHDLMKSPFAYCEHEKAILPTLLLQKIQKDVQNLGVKKLYKYGHTGSKHWLNKLQDVLIENSSYLCEYKFRSFDYKKEINREAYKLSFETIETLHDKIHKQFIRYVREAGALTNHPDDYMHGYSGLDLNRAPGRGGQMTLPSPSKKCVEPLSGEITFYRLLQKTFTPIVKKRFLLSPIYVKNKLEITLGKKFSDHELDKWETMNEKRLMHAIREISYETYNEICKEKQISIKKHLAYIGDGCNGALGYSDYKSILHEVNLHLQFLANALKKPSLIKEVSTMSEDEYVENKKNKKAYKQMSKDAIRLEFKYYQALLPNPILIKPEGFEINQTGTISISKDLKSRIKENITYVTFLGQLRDFIKFGIIRFNERVKPQGEGPLKVYNCKRFDRRTFKTLARTYKDENKKRWAFAMDLMYKQMPYLPRNVFDIIGLDLRKAQVKRSLVTTHLIKR